MPAAESPRPAWNRAARAAGVQRAGRSPHERRLESGCHSRPARAVQPLGGGIFSACCRAQRWRRGGWSSITAATPVFSSPRHASAAGGRGRRVQDNTGVRACGTLSPGHKHASNLPGESLTQSRRLCMRPTQPCPHLGGCRPAPRAAKHSAGAVPRPGAPHGRDAGVQRRCALWLCVCARAGVVQLSVHMSLRMYAVSCPWQTTTAHNTGQRGSFHAHHGK